MENNSSNYLIQLGKNIKLTRESLNLSQEELAMMSGLHRTFIGAVERGENNISFNNLVNIAGVLGISLEKLFEGIKPKPPQMTDQFKKIKSHFDKLNGNK